LELAAAIFHTWQSEGKEEQFQQFEQELDRATRLEPKDNAVWLIAGDWYFQAFSKLWRSTLLDRR